MHDDFSPQFLEQIRDHLEGMRADLINKSHLVRNELRAREREPRDAVDESADEQGTTTQLRLKDRERNLLALINNAITRIDTEDYGYCEICGDLIGEARLLARPMATMCIECKADQEELEARQTIPRPGLFTEYE